MNAETSSRLAPDRAAIIQPGRWQGGKARGGGLFSEQELKLQQLRFVDQNCDFKIYKSYNHNYQLITEHSVEFQDVHVNHIACMLSHNFLACLCFPFQLCKLKGKSNVI